MITESQWEKMSPAEQFALDPVAFEAYLETLSDAERKGLLTSWDDFWARPSQREPACAERCGSCAACDWREWLLLTGRGFG